MIDLEYLESERKKLWSKLLDIENDLKKKTSEYESEAKQASRKASEYKNKCELTKNEALTILEKLNLLSAEIDKSIVFNQINAIKEFESSIEARKSALDTKITSLETLFVDYDEYSERINNLEDLVTTSESSATKIDAAFLQLTNRKKEIDQFYYEIFGSVQTDEATSKEIKIIGRREELNKAYDTIKSSFENFKKNEVDDKFEEWEKRFNAITQKVESLLPNALTAGLSHAHYDKKNAEIAERATYGKTFQFWVYILIVISLIPFGVSAYMIYTGTTLIKMFELLPRLVFAILPVYIPPLWVAISASKKMNLSKRLIEEYTHKEVVAKTFEGLSKQIEGIKDPKTSAELKAKLLNNILQISTDNPGNLISDYNKSDHPIMEKINNFTNKNNIDEQKSTSENK